MLTAQDYCELEKIIEDIIDRKLIDKISDIYTMVDNIENILENKKIRY
jgi:hypothetical protein